MNSLLLKLESTDFDLTLCFSISSMFWVVLVFIHGWIFLGACFCLEILSLWVFQRSLWRGKGYRALENKLFYISIVLISPKMFFSVFISLLSRCHFQKQLGTENLQPLPYFSSRLKSLYDLYTAYKIIRLEPCMLQLPYLSPYRQKVKNISINIV